MVGETDRRGSPARGQIRLPKQDPMERDTGGDDQETAGGTTGQTCSHGDGRAGVLGVTW